MKHRLFRSALDGLHDEGELRTRTKLLLNVAMSLSERLRLATAHLAADW